MTQHKYVYRGNEDEPFVEELHSRNITGGEHTIYKASMFNIPAEVERRTPLDDLDFHKLTKETVHVTGGISTSLAQTRRFTGRNKYAMVLDAQCIPFEPIEYSYDWFNANPGAHSHIRSSADGELRVGEASLGGGGPSRYNLVGNVKNHVRMSGPDYLATEGWYSKGRSSGSLPGTGPRSAFADEAEWVTFQSSGSIAGAVEGVVSVIEPLDVRVAYTRDKSMIPGDAPPAGEVAAEVYDMYREPLPGWVDYYLIVVDDFQDYKRGDGGWLESDINFACNEQGRVEPVDIPPKFTGTA